MLTGKNLEISLRFIETYRHLYALKKVSTKRDFCNEVGLYPQNFSLMEKGRIGCTLENMYNLASKFGVSIEWLVLNKGEMFNVGTAV